MRARMTLMRPTGVQLDQIPLNEITKVLCANDTSIQEKDIGGAGTIVLRATKKEGSASQFHFEARGQTLANRDGFFGKSDPFLRVLACSEAGVKQEIYQSEVIPNDLNPTWEPAVVDTGSPYSMSTVLEVQCWDRDKASCNDELIGFLQVTVGQIMTDDHWRYFPLKFDAQIQRMGSDALIDTPPEVGGILTDELLRNTEGLFCFQIFTCPGTCPSSSWHYD